MLENHRDAMKIVCSENVTSANVQIAIDKRRLSG